MVNLFSGSVMKHYLNILADILFIVLLALIIFFIVSNPDNADYDYKSDISKTEDEGALINFIGFEENINIVSAYEIALMFGWIEDKKPLKRKIVKDEIIPAEWIKYVGYVISEKKERIEYFKNMNNGKIIVINGEQNNKWEILEKNENLFILRNNDKKYSVKAEK